MSFFDDASLAFLPSSGAGKDGKAYSIKPTTGDGDFTFSRGSNLAATRVGPTGLIEKGRENLLLRSNQFDTTWVSINTTETGGETGYDGSSDAWLLTKTNANGRIYQSISSSGVQSISIYAKAGTLDWLRLQVIDAINNPSVFFDLQNGVIGVNAGANYVDSSIESIGTDGWYRVSITFDKAIYLFNIYPAEGDEDTSGTSGNIYIQDAQVEIGLAATDYIESGATTGKAGLLEDEPRFDYSGGATCPSLLLEPSRTQLVTQSEYFGGSDWVSSSNVNITDNVTTSPEGVQNAALINFTSGSNYFQNGGAGMVSGSTYTISCYVKRALSTDQVFRLYGNGNIVSGNFTATSEWQRFTYTFTAASTNFSCGLTTPSTCQIHLYGFQVEQASYPTSYIPNHSGGSVTRGADVCTGAGDASTFNDSEGVLYAEISALANDGTFRNISVSNGTTAQAIRIYYRSNDDQITFLLGSSSGSGITTSIPSATDYIKVAAKYDTDTIKLFVNGALINTISSLTMPTGLQQLDFNIAGVLPFYGKSKQILYFPEALSDADCITLTTL